MNRKPFTQFPSVQNVADLLERLYIAAEGAGLRLEDRRKAIEIAAILDEVRRALPRFSARVPFTLLDAAAGKSYVGLLAAKLLLEPLQRPSSVVTLEVDPGRVAASRKALAALACTISVECRAGDVGDPVQWPESPSLVVALHACGEASDSVIENAVRCGSRMILLVPCCTGKDVEAAGRAAKAATRIGVPRHAPVRRRFIQAWVDCERTWRLEAAGYETEVVEFVPPTVTPHNLLWRSRWVGEPHRREVARRNLAAWLRLSRLGAELAENMVEPSGVAESAGGDCPRGRRAKDVREGEDGGPSCGGFPGGGL